MSVLETLVKESGEEASFPQDLIKERARLLGMFPTFIRE